MNRMCSSFAFMEWNNHDQAEHEDYDTSTKVEGGNLDVGDYINP